MSKTYILELTAQELDGLTFMRTFKDNLPEDTISPKLKQAQKEAKADREAAELWLPWRAHPSHGDWWGVSASSVLGNISLPKTERAAKLAAAAPELLEAVKAAEQWRQTFESTSVNSSHHVRWARDTQPLIDRALRKVETGDPENK